MSLNDKYVKNILVPTYIYIKKNEKHLFLKKNTTIKINDELIILFLIKGL